MSYQVIARRYRPQTFKEVIGQDHVSESLAKSIVQNRVAHAYLFCGPRGCGKTTTARILAKALNCLKGPTPTPCNECDNCRSITDGSNVDVIEIDAASNNGVDDVRQLREYVQLAPSGMSKYRVYVIDEVHMLSTSAFNALLKTIEEPPSHAIFILATTEKHKVPVTIVSRCQQYDFKMMTLKDLVNQLAFIADHEEGLKIVPEERDAIMGMLAKAGRGSMRDAESLLEQLIAFSGGELTLEKTKSLLGSLPSEIVSLYVDAILVEDNREAIIKMSSLLDQGIEYEQVCKELLEYYRSLALLRVLGPENHGLDLTVDEVQRRMPQSQVLENAQLIQLMKLCTHAIEQLRKTVPGKVVLDLLTLDSIQVKQTMSLPEIVDQIRAIQKGLTPTTRAQVAYVPPASYTTTPRKNYSSQSLNLELPSVKLPSMLDSTGEVPSSENNEPDVVVTAGSNPVLDQVIEIVQNENPAVGAALRRVTVLNESSDQMVLGIDSSLEFQISSLERPEIKQLLDVTLTKIKGAPCRFTLEKVAGLEARLGKKKPAKAQVRKNEFIKNSGIEMELKKDPMVLKVIELFGAAHFDYTALVVPAETENSQEEKE